MTPETGSCAACKADLNPGDRFCRACGRELSPAELARTGGEAPTQPAAGMPAAPVMPPSPLAPPPSPVPTIKWPTAGPIGAPLPPSYQPPVVRAPGRPSAVGRGLRAFGRGAAGCLAILVALGVLGFVLNSIGGGDADTPRATSTARPTSTGRATVRPAVPLTPVPESSPRAVTLAEAVSDGLVEVLAEGRNLQVLDLTLTSLVDEPLEVVIPAGLLFDAKASGTQSMVVTEQEMIELGPNEELSWPLDVACAAMDLDTPGGDDTFSIATASAKLRALVTSAGFAAADFRIQQFAIWTITDNPTQSGFVGIGSGGFGSGPTDGEIAEIKALFKAAGLDPSDYRALR